ncbi:hypothetical protein [Yoonia sp.]|uniref:hypothetical protein n=1 Tax=Yoonia sp. TaxID=2212373 RepID=UPI003F6CFC13
MLRMSVLLWCLLAGSSFAQAPKFLSSDGTLFEFAQNKHGVVLTAVEQGQELLVDPVLSAPIKKSGDAIYLGRGCDAYSPKLGDGRWLATDGGFLVRFGAATLAFPGQQIDVGTGDRCRR